jgi:hypothetical protein
MEGSSLISEFVGGIEENDGYPVLVKILTREPLTTMPDFNITSANGSISGKFRVM